MEKLVVICVDDEREILTSVEYDLEELAPCIEIELCESAEETLETIDYLNKNNERIALIITDQMMPGLKGADLLSILNKNEGIKKTKAILLTGQATHQDTVKAVNTLRLNYYISKPWKKDDLINVVKELLTDYVIEDEIDPTPYLRYLNSSKLLKSVATGGY